MNLVDLGTNLTAEAEGGRRTIVLPGPMFGPGGTNNRPPPPIPERWTAPRRRIGIRKPTPTTNWRKPLLRRAGNVRATAVPPSAAPPG